MALGSLLLIRASHLNLILLLRVQIKTSTIRLTVDIVQIAENLYLHFHMRVGLFRMENRLVRTSFLMAISIFQ